MTPDAPAAGGDDGAGGGEGADGGDDVAMPPPVDAGDAAGTENAGDGIRRPPVRYPASNAQRDPLIGLPDTISVSIPNLSIDLDILSLGGLLGDSQVNRKPSPANAVRDPLIEGPSSVDVSIPNLSIDANVASLSGLGGLLGGLLGDSQQSGTRNPAAPAGVANDPLLTLPSIDVSVPDLSVNLDVLSLG